MNRNKIIKELEGKKRGALYRLKANKYKTRNQVFKDYVKLESLSKEIEVQKANLENER